MDERSQPLIFPELIDQIVQAMNLFFLPMNLLQQPRSLLGQQPQLLYGFFFFLAVNEFLCQGLVKTGGVQIQDQVPFRHRCRHRDFLAPLISYRNASLHTWITCPLTWRSILLARNRQAYA